jgi:DNA polymerase I
MLSLLSRFKKIWVVDFEFIAKPSEVQKPVCVVAHDIISGETKRVWLYENQVTAPYEMDAESLFVAYFSSAEWNCHLAMGWDLPKNVIDLFVEFRNVTNHSGSVKVSSGLLAACKYYGVESID